MPDETVPNTAVPDETVPTTAVPDDDARDAAGPDDRVPDDLERVATPARVRRAPRYRAFVLAGALVGLLVAVVAVLVLPGDNGLGRGPVVVFVGLVGVLVGALGGAVVAVVQDRASRT
ncbi:hypothetical protein [Actinotalea subterranea]|uniref:hypothetical protein n=1 Tax=Actinotalea subterranea TaxID=2607497 RepID=UPI001FE91ED5|nr:hypothetical protein [Actinotalea subterranea]